MKNLWIPIAVSLLLQMTTVVSQETDAKHRITLDVAYGRKDGLVLTFDVHHPDQPNGAGIIYMNSGGHRSPTMDLGGSWPKRRKFKEHHLLLEDGFTVFDVRHGSVPRYTVPDAVSDVKRAVSFIRQHAEEFGVDPEKLGVWGFSAGGHLALMVGMTSEIVPEPSESEEILSEPPRVAAVVALAPLADLVIIMNNLPEGKRGPPGMDFGDERLPEFSPARFGSEDDPPTLLIHGDKDPLLPVEQSNLVQASLEAVGVESKVVVVEGARHGLYGEHSPITMSELRSWIRRHLLDS